MARRNLFDELAKSNAKPRDPLADMRSHIFEVVDAAFLHPTYVEGIGNVIKIPNLVIYAANLDQIVRPFTPDQLGLTSVEVQADDDLRVSNLALLSDMMRRVDSKSEGRLMSAAELYSRYIVTRHHLTANQNLSDKSEKLSQRRKIPKAIIDVPAIIAHKEYREKILPMFQGSVLGELGPGSGREALALHKAVDLASYNAMDIAPDFLNQTATRLWAQGCNVELMRLGDILHPPMIASWIGEIQNKHPDKPVIMMMIGLTLGNTKDFSNILHSAGRCLRKAEGNRPSDKLVVDVAPPQAKGDVERDYQDASLELLFTYGALFFAETAGVRGFDLRHVRYESVPTGYGVDRRLTFTERQILRRPWRSNNGTMAGWHEMIMEKGQYWGNFPTQKFGKDEIVSGIKQAGLEVVFWGGLPRRNPQRCLVVMEYAPLLSAARPNS